MGHKRGDRFNRLAHLKLDESPLAAGAARATYRDLHAIVAQPVTTFRGKRAPPSVMILRV